MRVTTGVREAGTEEIDSRLMPGHGKGDLIKGAFNRSCVGVLVERYSRYLIPCKMDDGTAEPVLEGFTRQMKKMPAFMRKSVTCDCGSEGASTPGTGCSDP